MLYKKCLNTDCGHCPFHGNCLKEHEMLKLIKELQMKDGIKYELAVLEQQDKRKK